MKKMRLVYINMNEEIIDRELPMEKWIVDWWFECNIVPNNDTNIFIVQLDGKSMLDDIKPMEERCVQFEEIARYFNWDELYNIFISDVNGGTEFENNSNDFEKWLLRNAT